MLRFAVFLFLAWAITPAAAFGAGNIASIAKVEGKNCRLNAASQDDKS